MRTSRPNLDSVRVAVVTESACPTSDLTEQLREMGIPLLLVDSPEIASRTLANFPKGWDVIVYPISGRWQPALDFVRCMRRVRESAGGRVFPPVLILSRTAQYPTTIDLFLRAGAARYSLFTTPDDLMAVLESTKQESLKSKIEAHKLHIRLVHTGNPGGIGCLPQEELTAVYTSFLPGEELPLGESASVEHFVNLLALNRWRFRTAPEIIRLMRQSPFYGDGIRYSVISVSSVKTYIARVESALSRMWHQRFGVGDPPVFVARESRSGTVVAYRLLTTCEIDHV